MFGGWRYPATLLRRADWAARAYADGVPMGGDLPPAPNPRRAPALIVQATKDPSGANLDRIQVMKVSRDGDGYKERIFDAALSGARREGAAGHAARVGDTGVSFLILGDRSWLRGRPRSADRDLSPCANRLVSDDKRRRPAAASRSIKSPGRVRLRLERLPRRRLDPGERP